MVVLDSGSNWPFKSCPPFSLKAERVVSKPQYIDKIVIDIVHYWATIGLAVHTDGSKLGDTHRTGAAKGTLLVATVPKLTVVTVIPNLI